MARSLPLLQYLVRIGTPMARQKEKMEQDETESKHSDTLDLKKVNCYFEDEI